MISKNDIDFNSTNFVVFDGVCLLCNTAVYYLHSLLKDKGYKFVPSQSKFGVEIISKYNLQTIIKQSVVVVRGDIVVSKSEAIFKIIKDLPIHWKIVKIFKILPTKVLNFFYDLIAKYRRLFKVKSKKTIYCYHE